MAEYDDISVPIRRRTRMLRVPENTFGLYRNHEDKPCFLPANLYIHC